MSSHHFVKEGQEPALLIVEPLSLSLVEPFLEWAPLVLVVDTALDEVLKWKIKIDVVLIHDNGNGYDEILVNHGPVERLYYSSFQNLLDVSIDFLIQKKNGGVTLVMNATSDAFNQLLLRRDKIDIVVITENMKWSAIPTEYKKWLPQKNALTVKHTDESIFTVGLKKTDGFETFETENDGSIEIKSDKPFWIGEMLD